MIWPQTSIDGLKICQSVNSLEHVGYFVICTPTVIIFLINVYIIMLQFQLFQKIIKNKSLYDSIDILFIILSGINIVVGSIDLINGTVINWFSQIVRLCWSLLLLILCLQFLLGKICKYVSITICFIYLLTLIYYYLSVQKIPTHILTLILYIPISIISIQQLIQIHHLISQQIDITIISYLQTRQSSLLFLSVSGLISSVIMSQLEYIKEIVGVVFTYIFGISLLSISIWYVYKDRMEDQRQSIRSLRRSDTSKLIQMQDYTGY